MKKAIRKFNIYECPTCYTQYTTTVKRDDLKCVICSKRMKLKQERREKEND